MSSREYTAREMADLLRILIDGFEALRQLQAGSPPELHYVRVNGVIEDLKEEMYRLEGA